MSVTRKTSPSKETLCILSFFGCFPFISRDIYGGKKGKNQWSYIHNFFTIIFLSEQHFSCNIVLCQKATGAWKKGSIDFVLQDIFQFGPSREGEREINWNKFQICYIATAKKTIKMFALIKLLPFCSYCFFLLSVLIFIRDRPDFCFSRVVV